MIKVFGQTDTSFSSNGDVVLSPLKAKVHKEDNGDYYLDLETGLAYIDYLVKGNIVVADTPQGAQAFRIDNPTKTKNKITARAWHVFYDSENYLIEDTEVVEETCNNALSQINSATEPQSPYTVSSDVTAVNSLECVRMSLYDTITAVLGLWGGHLVRDNFNIQIKTDIGYDNGITVQYRKNLKDISCEENWDNVVTKLLPVGKDEILLNAVDGTANIYVESDIQYSIPYVKTVSFSQDIDQSDYQTEAAYKQALVDDLLQQAEEYVEANSVPQVNYTMKANLEKVTDIGDIIEVIDERLGINLTASVIAFDYDCILGKYTEVEFGNFQKKLSSLLDDINASVNKSIEDRVQPLEDGLNDTIQTVIDAQPTATISKGGTGATTSRAACTNLSAAYTYSQAIAASATKSFTVSDSARGMIVLNGSVSNSKGLIIFNVTSAGAVTTKVVSSASNATITTNTNTISIQSSLSSGTIFAEFVMINGDVEVIS